MNGASTANGAIVMIRNSTTRPRAWSTDALKKMVPASAMVTNASAAPLVAVVSMSVARPVRPIPCAPVTRCTRPAVRRDALPLACVPDLTARPVAKAAFSARRSASDIRTYPVLLVTGDATSIFGDDLTGRPHRRIAAGAIIGSREHDP